MMRTDKRLIHRVPAYPLITVDPYFSVWSGTDALTDRHTMHWTGMECQMSGFIKIDGVVRRFIGQENAFPPEKYYLRTMSSAMYQKSAVVNPMDTVYVFESEGIELTVHFYTPLFLDKPELFSRPVSYIRCEMKAVDGAEHEVEIYFDMSSQFCTTEAEQSVNYEKGVLSNGTEYISMGRDEQPVLEKDGDHIKIDWGRVYLACNGSCFAANAAARRQFVGNTVIDEPFEKEGQLPVIGAVINVGRVKDSAEVYITVAYDDFYSIEYFHKKLKAYCYKYGAGFMDILNSAVSEKEELYGKCEEFDNSFCNEYKISDAYRELLAICYRQAIAAHKAVDNGGELLFLSKECHSNGCIGTADVSYPSMPLFLIYNPELVNGMIRPIFEYARSEVWGYDFAPHDVGTYPKANGQVYDAGDINNQMPVEECGNMIIMTYAAAHYGKDYTLAKENLDLLKRWADYLVENGYNPGNQLCTDDFAGHLAHNANLSVKAIVGIACFGRLLDNLGMSGGDCYTQTAKRYAQSWEKELAEDDHTMLAFDAPGTWSQKYNLVWDDIWKFGLFSRETVQKEIKFYIKQQLPYGVPLDSRKPYTKADWLLWSAAMAEDEKDFEAMLLPIIRFLNDTPDRDPFADWYSVEDRRNMRFSNRTVMGGAYMKLLKLTESGTE
ncbi:MAG: glutaminase domain-containing protein [Candidatus Ornithomonoglobus sp.]